EEVGCLGAPSLIAFLNANLPAPAAVVVGEPTEMKVVTGHKGITRVRTTVTGHEGHSSRPHQGVSAVMVAAELIGVLQKVAENVRIGGPHNALFDPSYTTITVNRISGGTEVNIMAGHCTFEWDIRALPDDNAQSYIRSLDEHCRKEVIP